MNYSDRQEQKARWELYRLAARRIYAEGAIREQCAVNEDLEHTGAFIEVVMWIPHAEIEHQRTLERLKKEDEERRAREAAATLDGVEEHEEVMRPILDEL